MFRVGRSDETATTTGLTHLVEHLALPARSRRSLDFNGTVDNILTCFWAAGPEAEAREFVRATTATLSALPIERLQTERQVLLAEEATQGPNLTRLAFALRYGPLGQGLTGYDEYGLRRISAEEVTAWASSRFNRGNAAIWMTGPDPGSLGVDLPEGPRYPPPETVTIQEVAESLPSLYRGGPPGAIALSIESARTPAFRVGLSILGHRIQDRLRFELGLTYEVESVFVPLTAESVHVVIVCDATEQNARRVCEEILSTIDTLAADGPTPEELQEELLDTQRLAADRSQVTSQLFYAAAQHLMGESFKSAREHLETQERLTAAEVAAAIEVARRSAIVIVPEAPAELSGLNDYPTSSPVAVTGRRFTGAGVRLRRRGWEPVLTVGEQGVTIAAEQWRTTVAFDQCVALLRYPDDTRTLLGEDGYFAHVDPRAWRRGMDAAAAIDAAVPEELVIRMEPALTAHSDAVERVAAEKLKRRWVVSEELELLPGRLEHGETILTLCEASKGMRAGLLAVTDRRLIFFARIRKETWLEFTFGEIDRIEGSEGILDSTVKIEARGEEITFSGIAPKERTLEVVGEVESRRGG